LKAPLPWSTFCDGPVFFLLLSSRHNSVESADLDASLMDRLSPVLVLWCPSTSFRLEFESSAPVIAGNLSEREVVNHLCC
jgi:hypothetical protein